MASLQSTQINGYVLYATSTVGLAAYDVTVGTGATVKWTLRRTDGTIVTTNQSAYVYRVKIVTTGTGTDTGTMFLAQNVDGVGWVVRTVHRDGVGSNHPYLFVDSDGLPKVTIDHPANYTVRVIVEETNGGNSGATYGVYGADAIIGYDGSGNTKIWTGSTLLFGANTVLHSGNYNSYSPTLTGGGASGTWGINVTGTAASETLATVTGRGNTTTNRIGVSTSTALDFAPNGNIGTWLGGIQDSTSGWAISNNGLGLKADNTTYAGIVLGSANGLLYFGRTQGGVGTMNTWLTVNNGLVANFTSRPQFGGNNLALFSEIPTNLNQLTNGPGYITSSSLSGYVPYGNWSQSTGMNDSKLYFRTNGDNNHYLWNAGDDWEELNAYEGTGFRITSVGGTVGVLYVYGSSNGGYTYSPYSFRAPVFYDSANTAYYLDPNATGVSLNVAGRMTGASWTTSGRNYSNEWIEFPNYSGLYSPNNGAHLRPNSGSYGPWLVTGTRNGYSGIEFESLSNGNVSMMINSNSNLSGWHNNSYGWQFRWENGTAYVSKNSYGGGTSAVVLDSSNYTSYAPSLTGSGASGTWNISISGNADTVDGYHLNQDVRTTAAPSFQYIGVNPSGASNNGYGISLYGGASAGPTYGIFFQGTSTYGTHGSVTGDWATYFTMNNDDTRGWIWRKTAASNVASLSAGGVFQINGSVRAPIFYDSQDTNYYIDGNSGSALKYLRVNGDWGSSPFGSGHETLTVTGSYASICQRSTVGAQAYVLHHVDDKWSLYIGRGSTNGSSWDWAMRAYPTQDGNHVEFRTSARAPIFYDSANTAYYVDPNSTSNLVGLILNSTGGAGSPTLRINTSSSSAFVHSQENIANNITSGQHNIIVVGQAASTKNSGYIGYYWAGAGSNSNFVTIGHWGADDLFRVYGDGTVTVGASTVLHAGNYNSYAPTLTGGGASGTWGISITGSAGSASTASQVTINYNNDSNANYQMLWGSGNNVYGTAGVYLNPASDYVYASSFNASDWFRSSGNTGWYNSSYGGGIYQTESTMVRVYDNRGFWIDGGNSNTVQDATLYVQATNNNDWGAVVNKYTGSATEYGIEVRVGSGANYGYSLTGNGSRNFYVTGSGAVYGTVFYDINNTAYYLDPASTSNLGGLTLACNVSTGRGSYGKPLANLVLNATAASGAGYAAIDFRSGGNYPSDGAQIYYESDNGGVSGESSRLWIRVENDAADEIYLRAGRIYYDSNTVDGGSQSPGHVFRYAGSDAAYVYNGYLQGVSSLRAPIFYDSDDTTYYADFANSGTSIYTAGIIRSSGVQVKGSSGGGQIYPTMSNGGVSLYGGNNFTNGAYFTVTGLDYASSPGAGSAEFVIRNTATSKFALFSYNGSTWTGRYGLFGSTGNVTIGDANTDIGYRLYVIGDIYATGNIIAYSDKRVKTNIREIENPLDRVLNSRGVLYDRTDTDDKNQIGFIAQELEEQFPELVSTSTDGRKGVLYPNMVAVLLEAMKEQQKQINELKSKLN